jgi:hypothetical protein
MDFFLLQNLVKGTSPQQEEIKQISQKYLKCDSHLGFILPANFIKKPNFKALKKQNRNLNDPQASSLFNSLFCGIKEKVNSRKHSSSSNNNINRHSYIDKTSTSVTDSANEHSSSTSSTTTKRSLTPDPVNYFDNGKMNSSSSSSNKFPSSISSPNLAKQDSGSSTTTTSSNRNVNFDLINLSEDYSRFIEEREKARERRMSGSRGTQTPSSGSSANSDINRTPKSRKKTVMLQAAPNRDLKPAMILRLEDRDLIVIDKQDIKEAVRNESDVIIVDPPPPVAQTPLNENDHAELSDILGNKWPDSAGATASLLNTDNKKMNNSSSSTSSSTNVGNGTLGRKTIDRNRSANIASHFSSTNKRYDIQNGRKSE